MKSYYPSINLLRGIAALMVCFYHFTNYSDVNGSLFSNDLLLTLGVIGSKGVYIFFVISGFVIPLSLFKYDFKLKNFGRFFLKRIIRIEIPYLASVLLIMLVAFLFAFKNSTSFDFNFNQFIFHFLYLIPFTDYSWYNIIYWTLAIEFQYYILIGLVYFLIIKKEGYLNLIIIFIFIVSGFFVNDDRYIFFYSPIFAIGITLFLLKFEKINKLLGLILVIICILSTFYHFNLTVVLLTVATFLFIYFLEVDNKYTNSIGNISFSLYLTHGLIGNNILYIFSSYELDLIGKIGAFFIAFLASIVFATLFWKIIEKPSQYLSKNIKMAN